MNTTTLLTSLALCSLSLSATAAMALEQSKFADVNGTRLHYIVSGQGDPVVLLHGYAETSHMWEPLIPKLAATHLVIAPDLRGAGDSAAPDGGYTKVNMARDIHALVESLGLKKVSLVGHDIGLMVAYAYAAQYPQEVQRIVLMDAFLPGIGSWQDVWLLRDKWHFNFYGETPLRLVQGRERIYLEHFWNDFAADPKHSVPEADRRLYAKAYAQPGHMQAGFEYFHAFSQDAQDFAVLGKQPLTMPMLVLSGEKASGQFLIDQAKLIDTQVRGVIVRGSGHWLMEEAPEQTIPALVAFLSPGNDHVPGAAQVPHAVEKPVFSSSLPNVPGKTLTAVQVDFAAGARSPSHAHAGSVFGFVISGKIRSENSATGPARVYNAGEGFFEPPGSTHKITENASDSEPASLLAVFVADDGAQLTRKAP